MRIGIHLGDCIGGIIGSEHIRYDIWGQDVLIAMDIEQNAEPGNICFSKAYMDQLLIVNPEL